MTALPVLKLRAHEERRLREGHVWIYSNEVDTAQTPLKSFSPGDEVLVEDSQGRPLGLALMSPNALICARLFQRDLRHPLTVSLMVHRIQIALSLRERWFPAPYYRLIYGDSDGLPGVVVDRFGDYLVLQVSLAGMEQRTEALIEALVKVLKPAGILLKNDGKMREVEDLPVEVRVGYGEVPEQLTVIENGVTFAIEPRQGQKTGWFYDHRDARARLQGLVSGLRVLDVFSYVGGWGVQAAAFGAAEVLCVDASARALAQVQTNAALNQVADRVSVQCGDAFDVMAALKAEHRRFDVVIVDPPAFIARRKDHKAGLLAYRRTNELAMRLLDREGLLVTGSCSMHLSRPELIDVVRGSARHIDRQAQVLWQGHQGADHPVHPAIPETDYLKSLMVRVLPQK